MVKLATFASIALAVLGAWLALRGFYVWNSCGYDCGIFGVNRGISVIIAMPAGLLLSLIAVSSLIALAISRDSNK